MIIDQSVKRDVLRDVVSECVAALNDIAEMVSPEADTMPIPEGLDQSEQFEWVLRDWTRLRDLVLRMAATAARASDAASARLDPDD